MACGPNTYGAALSALLPGTAATFAIAELDGSATKKIRLLRIAIGGTELTPLGVNDLRLTKLSSISTGGAATTATAVPFLATLPAATAIFRGFTTAPTGGGVVLGALAVIKLVTDLVTVNPVGTITIDFSTLPLGSRPTLNNATEALALDFNGATNRAMNLDIYAWWTEQPLNS